MYNKFLCKEKESIVPHKKSMHSLSFRQLIRIIKRSQPLPLHNPYPAVEIKTMSKILGRFLAQINGNVVYQLPIEAKHKDLQSEKKTKTDRITQVMNSGSLWLSMYHCSHVCVIRFLPSVQDLMTPLWLRELGWTGVRSWKERAWSPAKKRKNNPKHKSKCQWGKHECDPQKKNKKTVCSSPVTWGHAPALQLFLSYPEWSLQVEIPPTFPKWMHRSGTALVKKKQKRRSTV